MYTEDNNSFLIEAMQTEIAFIGLGAMGVPILRNLLTSSVVFKAFVHNRTRSVAEDFVAQTPSSPANEHPSICICESPAEALRSTNPSPDGGRVVVSIVSNDTALNDICESLQTELHSGDVHLCLSTVSPDCVDAHEAQHHNLGAFFISCPVFGRPPVAVARKLIVVPGGNLSAFERVRPILQAISQTIVYAGSKASNANILKLCGNFCILSFIQMEGECFALAESHDIPRSTAFELLFSSEGVFNKIPILQTYGAIIQAGLFKDVGFSAENGLKDATLICNAANGHLDGAAIMHIVKQRLTQVCNEDPEGGRSVDWASFARLVKVKAKVRKPEIAVADKQGEKALLSESSSSISSYIDHTVLKPTATHIDIRQAVAEAIEHRFAAVCVPPGFVSLSKSLLLAAGLLSPPKVATVIGFPFGYSCTAAKIAEIQQAIADGADELDVVANISHIKSHDWSALQAEIDKIMPVIRSSTGRGRVIKVIIESGLLSDEEIIQACQVYNSAGIDYLKTSTGYAEGGKGATLEHVRLFRSQLSRDIRIKASGGIRDFVTASAFVEAGADRIGCSAGVAIVSGALAGAGGNTY